MHHSGALLRRWDILGEQALLLERRPERAGDTDVHRLNVSLHFEGALPTWDDSGHRLFARGWVCCADSGLGLDTETRVWDMRTAHLPNEREGVFDIMRGLQESVLGVPAGTGGRRRPAGR